MTMSITMVPAAPTTLEAALLTANTANTGGAQPESGWLRSDGRLQRATLGSIFAALAEENCSYTDKLEQGDLNTLKTSLASLQTILESSKNITLSIQEAAQISLDLAQLEHVLPSGKAKTIISKLALFSQLNWMVEAREHVEKELLEQLSHWERPGNSDSKACSFSLGTGFGITIGNALKAAFGLAVEGGERETMSPDDEGFPFIMNMLNGTAEVKATAKVDLLVKVKGRASANASVLRGCYIECDSLKDMIQVKFNKLLLVHVNSLDHISRRHTLKQVSHSVIDFLLRIFWPNWRCELHSYDAVFHQARLLQPDFSIEIGRLLGEAQANVTLTPLDITPLELNIFGNQQHGVLGASVSILDLASAGAKLHIDRQEVTLSGDMYAPFWRELERPRCNTPVAIQTARAEELRRRMTVLEARGAVALKDVCGEQGLADCLALTDSNALEQALDRLDAVCELFFKAQRRTECEWSMYRELRNTVLDDWQAATPEAVLHHMCVLHALLGSQIKDHAPKLLDKVQRLADKLKNPPFTYDEKALRMRTGFATNCAQKRIDHMIEFELNIGALYHAAGGKIGVSLLHRQRMHSNSLREGSYLDLTIKAGASLLLPSDIAQLLVDRLQETEMPPDLAEQGIQDMLLEHLKLDSECQIERGMTRLYRFYLPSQKELAQGGYRALLTRNSVEDQRKIGGTVSTALLSPGYYLSMGGHWRWDNTRVRTESFSGNTLLHVFMYYMHEKRIERDLTIRWGSIVEQQRAAFSSMFVQIGQDGESTIQSEMKCFLREIAAFDKENALVMSQDMEASLKEAMRKFTQEPNSDAAFKEACSALTQFMDAYYPIWLNKRMNSACMVPLPLTGDGSVFPRKEDDATEHVKSVRQVRLMG